MLNSEKSSWTSTKLPSRRRRKLGELIDYTRSLVYLGVDVLMRGTPWCEPRVRIKQRVRAVGVRSELIRVLPPSQRGILVADAVASLWIAGGTSFGVRQLRPMSSKLAGALTGSEAKRYGKRARVLRNIFLVQVCTDRVRLPHTFTLSVCSSHAWFPWEDWMFFSFCACVDAPCAVPGLRAWYGGGLPCDCRRRVCPSANSRQEVQRSISPQLKVIRVCPLKLESSYMPRVIGQAGCRICDLFCASLSLVSWHWSAREITARFLEEWLMIRCGEMRCTVSCIASYALLCSELDSGQRWDCFLHVWQKMVSARDARRVQKTSCTACGTARRMSSTGYS